jgi:hypothetical protein
MVQLIFNRISMKIGESLEQMNGKMAVLKLEKIN